MQQMCSGRPWSTSFCPQILFIKNSSTPSLSNPFPPPPIFRDIPMQKHMMLSRGVAIMQARMRGVMR